MVRPRKSIAPWIKDEVTFYPHQIEGVRHLAKLKSFLLADDMGLGKSLQSMTVFAIDVVRGWSKTAIVVCPVTLKGNWSDEIEKFTGFSHVVLEGTPKQREAQLLDFVAIDRPKILVVNYEQVVAHLDLLNSLNFDVAIFDEAHYLKNHKSKRTEACLSLKSRRSFLLTGTPMLNHVNELWTLLHRIQPDRWPKYYSFVSRYAVFGGYKDKQIVGVKNEAKLTEQLNSVMLRRLKEDVLDLPEVQYIERRVNLLPEQQKLYDEVSDELKLHRVGQDDADSIENALTKMLRLKQICASTYPFMEVDHSAKLDLAIEDDVELLENGQRVVVFTQFRPVIERYVARMEAQKLGVPVFQIHGDVAKSERSNVVKTWGATATPGVIVCGLQVAGVGLNMTQARHASFIDKLYVPGLNKQAVDRLHRIGADKTQPVQVRDYICRGTIENRINQILSMKTKINKDVIDVDLDWKRKLVAAILEEDIT